MPVTEALSDEEACLVAILTDASGLEAAEFCWYDPVDEEDGVNDGCWRARPYQVSWWRDAAPLQIDQCIAGSQRVLTRRGLVPIAEVSAGDEVRTHRGRWRPVTTAWCRGERSVVRVRGRGCSSLVVTRDHPFLVRRNGKLTWAAPRSWPRCSTGRVDGLDWLVDGEWAPILSVTTAGRATVYDLEVDEDGSFVVEGVVVHNCARDVGKSLGIQARAYAFPYAHPGGEMVLTAPELVHLEPLTTAIEQRQFSNRLGVEMMPRARSRLVRRPFRMNFVTGSRIVGRIPQVTGRGVKGLHCVVLEADEMQDFPEAGWMELIATLRRGIKGAKWRAHGVTRGIRDKFWEFTQPSDDNPFKVHRITAMHRPDWSDEERQLNIQLYGSREAPDYRRNILGLHGDQTNVLFVIHRLMRGVDSIEASTYNSEEYQYFRITAEQLEDLAGPGSSSEEQARAAEQLLTFSDTHERYGPHFWVGQDVGFTADPTEILIAAEYVPSPAEIRADKAAHRTPPEKGVTRLRILCRIHLERITNPIQMAIILHVIDHYKPRAYGIDKTGNGLGLFQDVQAVDVEIAKVIRGYNFSENVIVGIDGTVTVTDQEDVLKEAALRSNVLEYSTDKLRDLIDAARWFMPWDRDMLKQFQGQTWCTDSATEIFTRRGWLSCDQVRPGDETLGISDQAGTPVSCWTPITAVTIFPAAPREVVVFKGQTHSSVTTTGHRWLVKPYNHAKYLEWRTTDEMCSDARRYRIPLTAVRADIPTVATYDDDFVELVAWYYTEGHRCLGGRIALSQSPTANPIMVERIESLLTRLLGPGDLDPGRGTPGPGRWSRTTAKTVKSPSQYGMPSHAYRVKDVGLSAAVLKVVQTYDKVVSMEFLTRLTMDQLDLFIKVSIWADGCGFDRHRAGKQDTAVRSFKQSHEGRARVFELACALRGEATMTTYVPALGEWRISVLHRRYSHSTSMRRTREVLVDRVWCPTTGTGTWLARRQGAVFFTGNSYSKTLSTKDERRRRRVFSAGSYHCLDAARMLAMAHAQAPIEELVENLRHPTYDDVVDVFIS